MRRAMPASLSDALMSQRWRFRRRPLRRHRPEMVDRGQHGEQHEAQAQAPDDQLLLDRQQRLDRAGAELAVQIGGGQLRHDDLLMVVHFPLVRTFVGYQLASGGVMPWKNSHEIKRPTQMTKPKMLIA